MKEDQLKENESAHFCPALDFPAKAIRQNHLIQQFQQKEFNEKKEYKKNKGAAKNSVLYACKLLQYSLLISNT